MSKLSFPCISVLSIRVLQAQNAHAQRFPTVETLEDWGDGREDVLQLSARSIIDHSENGAVRLVFVAYNEFDAILVPQQQQQQQQQQRRYSSPDRDGPDRSDTAPSLRFINSKVIGASLGKGRHVRLADPVQITLKHLRSGSDVSGPVCVYWDYTSLAWSGAGCRLVGTNATHSRCECNHLTNFALLMEEGGDGILVLSSSDDVTTVALEGAVGRGGSSGLSSHITTIIACVATLVCLTLMLFAFVLTWRKFRVSHQCRSMLQKSGIPCFHKTKELSEKDKKAGNFYTVTPKLNNTGDGSATGSGAAAGGSNLEVNNIELDNEQYFQHMLSMQKNQETSILGGLSKTMSRRNTVRSLAAGAADMQQQETSLGTDVVDLAKSSHVAEHNLATRQQQQHQLTLNSSTRMRNNNTAMRPNKTQCQHHPLQQQQHGTNTSDLFYPKQNNNNMGRAMSPFNHIYMEIDPKTTSSASASSSSAEEAALYEALNQSETYNILSSVSDMSDDDFRRRCCRGGGGGESSDLGSSRQSSARCCAENKPLLFRASSGGKLLDQQQQQQHRNNLLTTISGVLQHQQQHSQSLRLPPQHHRTSILSTISGLRYTTTDPSQPGRPTLLTSLAAAGESGHEDHGAAPPLQVTTVNGSQFVCLNLNNEENNSGHNTSTYVTASDLNQCYASLSDTYITTAAAAGQEFRGLNTASFVTGGQQLAQQQLEQQQLFQPGMVQSGMVQPGMVQTPVHSQVVIQRIGTLPRQYAHPLAHH